MAPSLTNWPITNPDPGPAGAGPKATPSTQSLSFAQIPGKPPWCSVPPVRCRRCKTMPWSEAKKRTDRLNVYLMTKARSSNELSYLASPVTGGGVTVPRFQQLFCWPSSRATSTRRTGPTSWNILALQNQRRWLKMARRWKPSKKLGRTDCAGQRVCRVENSCRFWALQIA